MAALESGRKGVLFVCLFAVTRVVTLRSAQGEFVSVMLS